MGCWVLSKKGYLNVGLVQPHLVSVEPQEDDKFVLLLQLLLQQLWTDTVHVVCSITQRM